MATQDNEPLQDIWTDQQTQRLKDLSERGATVTCIVEDLGDVSEAQVAAMAGQLGLKARKVPDHLVSGPFSLPFLSREELEAALGDNPMRGVLGGSVDFERLARLRWGNGDPFLSAILLWTMDAAAWKVQYPRDKAADPVCFTAGDFLATAVSLGERMTRSDRDGFDAVLASELRSRGIRAKSGGTIQPAPDLPSGDLRRCLVNWDLAELLIRASQMRSALGFDYRAVTQRYVWMAAMGCAAGQKALQSCGMLGNGFETFRDAVAETLRRVNEHAVIDAILLEYVSRAPDLLNRRLPPPEYLADRSCADEDAMGTREDARALAGLITLQAASPPLAIGVFGSWGSGKSTLLAQIQDEVAREVEEERTSPTTGEDAQATRRVANVVQVSLNAWTFADSGNLWASITSEIFDQVAAGGMDHRDADIGAKLVTEVARRSDEEAAHLRAALALQDDSKAALEQAEREVEAAERDRTSAPLDAVRDALLAALKAGEETRPKTDEADPSKKTSAAKRRDAMQALGDALCDEDGDIDEETLKRYLDAEPGMVRSALVAWDLARKTVRTSHVILAVAALGAAVCIAQWVTLSIYVPAAWNLAIRILTPSFVVCAGIWHMRPLFLSAWRGAAALHQAVNERTQAARERLRLAKAKAAKERAALHESAHERQKREEFISKYRGTADGGMAGAPGVMLEYLLRDSADAVKIRSQLGTLATVRRCFDQLSAIIRAGRRNRDGQTVERIVVYFDDLDRCTEEQVVAVMQAVHLLLAYDCFVAVVAVDARWLKHSLDKVYTQLARTDSEDSDLPTSADYLEKIFQIVFWVKSMRGHDARDGGHTYRNFVSAMINPERGKAPAVSPIVNAAPPTQGSAQHVPSPSRTVLQGDQASETPGDEQDPDCPFKPLRMTAPFAPAPETSDRAMVALTLAERNLMPQLGGLADKSPRAVKRMVNLYRLIRASLGARDLEVFLGGGSPQIPSFAAVQLALALDLSLPADRQAQLIEAFCATPQTAWDEACQLAETGLDDRDIRLYGPLREALTEACILSPFLGALRAANEVSPRRVLPDDIRAASLIVGRYSFNPAGKV